MKRPIWLRILAMALLAALIGNSFAGCGIIAPDEEEIFSKTIHDFEGHEIVQLGPEEDRNFLVYSENVKTVATSADVNQLVSVDEEKLAYTFASPDETLLSMETGTVFFTEASPSNTNSVAVKVKEIQVTGDTAIVYSDSVEMKDLFTHINVDTELSMADAWYDAGTLSEGMDIQPLSGSEGLSKAMEANGAEETESPDWSWEGGSNTTQILLSAADNVDLGFASSGNIQGKMFYQYKTQVLMRSIHVSLRYDKEANYLYSNVEYIVDTSFAASVGFEGTWSNGRGGMGKTWPVVNFFIPGTPIQVGVETFLLTELNGSLRGTFNQYESFRVGMSSVHAGVFLVKEDSVCDPIGNQSDADLELEGSIEVSYGIRADIGVPFVVDVFVEGAMGARAVGKEKLLNEKDSEEYIHDCDRCLDGDIEVFARVNAGIDARIVSLLTGKDLVYRKQIAELSVKVGDFYASYREWADERVECGFGPCPHLRWRVTVNVETEEDGPAQGAKVKATYPDGRTDQKMTDEDGEAVFYMPSGDNALACSHHGERGSAQVIVEDEPASAELKLDDKRQLFVCYRFFKPDGSLSPTYDDFKFTEVYNILQMNYPDAVYVHIHEWFSHIENSPNDSLVFTNYTAEGLDEAYGVTEGDVILFVQAHQRKEDVWGCKNISYWLGVFLLPEIPVETTDSTGETAAPTEETTPQEDIPFMIAVSKVNVTVWDKLDSANGKAYVSKAYYEACESIWQGLRIDEDYRILDIGTEWTEAEWEDPAPGVGMSPSTFWSSYSMHHDNLANYVYRLFPYIDALMAGEWNEFQGS